MLLVAALAFVVAVPSAPGSVPPAGGMSAAAINSMYRTYGDTSGEWNGGDSTASVLLPDGRLVWLFSDTFLGPINADGTRPANTPMVHNTIVVQEGSQLVDTLYNGTITFPKSLVGSEHDGEADNAGYWVADGTVEGSTLKVLYSNYKKTGTGSLDLQLAGTWLATFALPSLTLSSLTDLQKGTTVAWGSAILEDGSYTYIYGTEFAADGMKFAHLARVPAGGLSGAWQYWSGSGWSSQADSSARILSGVGTTFGVQQIGTQYVLVTMDTNLAFSPTVVAYTASSPSGPWTGPKIVYTAPEPETTTASIVYDTRVHPALATSGKLLFSYNVNTLTKDGNFTDARLYRPRFVDVAWPLPSPDPATLPAAPTDLAASVNDEGTVHLTWAPSSGATRHWLYQKDLTAGQTHVARMPGGLTQNFADLSGLRTDHTYEFSVSAENASGEGPRSAAVSVTPVIPRPPAPTGVSATTNTTGTVTVSWTAVPKALSYQVMQRDVTAGETTFHGMSEVGSTQTSQELEWLTQGDEYEFYVVAKNGGGESDPSAKVRATVRYDLPPAPTGLTAASNPDGTIALHWTAPYDGLWYNVYQRDLTANETEYTQLPWPVTNGTEMTPGLLIDGHRYEYRVAALNGGGESPRSAPASAVSTYPQPPAPTGLTATAGDGEVKLRWNATDPDHWYWVYQRDVTAGEIGFTKLPLPVDGATTMTAGYLVNGHAYRFMVSALGPGGAEGPRSVAVEARPQVTKPGKPTNLSATANPNGTITLDWNTPTANVYHWVYQRDATAGTAWEKLTHPVVAGTKFTAGFLAQGHRYEYKVVAFNDGGESPESVVASAVCDYAPPSAPPNLRGSTDGNGAIDLNWDSAGRNLYYWVYYRDVTEGESFTKGPYPTDETHATMGLLKHGHVYEYKVTASNAGGEGPASSKIQVTARGGLPAPPSNLTATAGNSKVTLHWAASSTPDVWYVIEYRSEGDSWRRLSAPDDTCCSFVVGFLGNGTTYDFRVRATNSHGNGKASNVASAKPMPPLPTAPTGLSADAGNGKVNLQWTASSSANVWYVIEYRPDGGTWHQLPYPDDTCCSFAVGYLANGTTYDFRVRATNMTGDSAPSNVVSARPMPPFPQPPTNLTVDPGLGKATLTWSASPTNGVWYLIEYRPTGGTWHQAKYPVASCCRITLDYLISRTYDFRVRATNMSGDSAPTNVVSVTMPRPHAPTGVTASQAGPFAAKISWNPVPGADGYIIYHDQPDYDIDFIPDLKPLKYPVMGGNKSSFTVDYLTRTGGHWWAVAAFKYGRAGPKSEVVEMGGVLMPNSEYLMARALYFDGGTYPGSTNGITYTKQADVDGGIIVARAFIGGGSILPDSPYWPISDGRGFNPHPYASSRIAVAWDTGRGKLSALALRSCFAVACKNALPIWLGYSGATDTQTVDYNYVWDDTSGSGDSLTFYWKVSNSVTNNLWKLGWHIDAKVEVHRSSGTNYVASAHVDHFPSYEIYQYPHYTTNGWPDSRTLGTCGQYQIDGLTDSPSERRWC